MSDRPLHEIMTEEREKESQRLKTEEFLPMVRRYKSFSETEIQAYVTESEDLEGLSYWTCFNDWKEVATDIRLWLTFKNEFKNKE